jgi:hypothetical protein
LLHHDAITATCYEVVYYDYMTKGAEMKVKFDQLQEYLKDELYSISLS